VDGTAGVFSFDGSTITQEGTFVPYALLIGEDGEVYATAYDSTIKTYVSTGLWTSVIISGSSQNRGMAFDEAGNIWIASTTGGGDNFGGKVVYSYNPVTEVQGSYELKSPGIAPVGMGKDASGNMWAVCRSDALPEGFIEGFNPVTLVSAGAIEVGFRPYAYSGFIMPEEPELYSLCGFKYRTETEIGLGGWLITLEKYVEGIGWIEVETQVTDIYGAYCFEGLLEGDYRISETPKDGWTKTAPVEDYHFVTLSEDVGEPETFFDFYNKPDMVCYDETIWAYGGEEGAYTDGAADYVEENNAVDGNSSNNWGWTNRIDGEGTYIFTLYRGAGQNDLEKGTPVGTLTVMYEQGLADVTYSVVAPYELSEAHLWIGETELPMIEKKVKKLLTEVPTSAPGQLSKLGYSPEISEDGLTATIEDVEIQAPFWVAAHGVVDWCEMVASEGTTYYHWEEGYPYGASPEIFATASVTSIGMDVWWLEGDQWFHDIYNITDTLGFTPYTVGSLNEPVKMLHEMHFPGLEDTWYQRTQVGVSEVPVPNAMSILIY